MSGKLIAFEGTEGGGKSTQIQLLAQRLRTQGRTVCLAREPGGTPMGEEIRHYLKHHNGLITAEAEVLLMNSSRALLVRDVIRPALARGEIVLLDRYYHSTLVYQGFGRELDKNWVEQVVNCAIDGCRPDSVLILFVSLEVSEQRRLQRNSVLPQTQAKDRFEEEDRAFFKKVEEGYLHYAHTQPDLVHLIDAAQSIAQVERLVWNQVKVILGTDCG